MIPVIHERYSHVKTSYPSRGAFYHGMNACMAAAALAHLELRCLVSWHFAAVMFCTSRTVSCQTGCQQ